MSKYNFIYILSVSIHSFMIASYAGATKRNKPELKRGDSIYARVTMAHRDLDTELVCTVASGPKRDWSTGENVSEAYNHC